MATIDILHSTNIFIHVLTGSIALFIGTLALITKKGGKWHTKSGKSFLILLGFVITTGLIGVFVFGRNTFLLVITLLSAYQGFSGYRILQTKSNQVKIIDLAAAIITLLSAVYFIFYIKSIGMMWAPIIIYSTVGYLLMVIAYDFLRYLIPAKSYKRLWFYEHLVKMIGALSAIAAAFSGTVFPNYQPFSQYAPSVLGTLLMIGFVTYYKFGKKT
jgi:hypothetical protein